MTLAPLPLLTHHVSVQLLAIVPKNNWVQVLIIFVAQLFPVTVPNLYPDPTLHPYLYEEANKEKISAGQLVILARVRHGSDLAFNNKGN